MLHGQLGHEVTEVLPHTPAHRLISSFSAALHEFLVLILKTLILASISALLLNTFMMFSFLNFSSSFSLILNDSKSEYGEDAARLLRRV